MSGLTNIQDAFQRFLLTGDSAIGSYVLGTARVPVETRLGIYGGAYGARLAEALESSFPVLARLLGESDFSVLASRYVSAHPSSFFSIRYYGDRLAEFLAEEPDYARAPLLAELARWEWAMAAAFDAADAEPLDVGSLAGVAPEEWARLQFDWSPSVQVLELHWNVPEIWRAVTDDSGPGNGGAGEGDSESDAPLPPEPRLQSGRWLIWRQALQIFFRPLEPDEAGALAASREGQSFGELCVALCEHLDEAEASRQAAGFLRGWVQSGLIVGVRA